MKKHLALKKYLKFFNIGLVVFLVIEVGALIFVDRSYLHENTGDITVQQIKDDVSSADSGYEVTLSGSEEDIKSSYDGKFIAYTIDGGLCVTDITNGKKYDISMDGDLSLNYYEWVYDRDQLIIVQKSKGGSYVKLFNLDVKQLKNGGVPEEIRDTVNNVKVKINLPTSSYDVSGIDFSTSTVTTYLKLTNKSEKSRLWKFNVPDENRMYSNISTRSIGKIQCLKFQTQLLYENTYSNTVCVAEKGAISIDGSKKLQLLGFDSEDKVYLAEGGNDTTDKIYYGSLVEEDSNGNSKLTLTPQMNTLDLKSSVTVSDVFVTLSGNVYANDSGNNVLTNLKSGTEISYQGKIIGMYNKGFLTLDGTTVKQNPFS